MRFAYQRQMVSSSRKFIKKVYLKSFRSILFPTETSNAILKSTEKLINK